MVLRLGLMRSRAEKGPPSSHHQDYSRALIIQVPHTVRVAWCHVQSHGPNPRKLGVGCVCRFQLERGMRWRAVVCMSAWDVFPFLIVQSRDLRSQDECFPAMCDLYLRRTLSVELLIRTNTVGLGIGIRSCFVFYSLLVRMLCGTERCAVQNNFKTKTVHMWSESSVGGR